MDFFKFICWPMVAIMVPLVFMIVAWDFIATQDTGYCMVAAYGVWNFFVGVWTGQDLMMRRG